MTLKSNFKRSKFELDIIDRESKRAFGFLKNNIKMKQFFIKKIIDKRSNYETDKEF